MGTNEPVRIQERRSAMDDDDKTPEDAAAEPTPDAAQEEGGMRALRRSRRGPRTPWKFPEIAPGTLFDSLG